MSIRLSRSAAKDLRDHVTYLHEENPRAARQLLAELDELLTSLDARVFDGPEKTLLSGRVVRFWPLPPLNVYYERRGDNLHVVRIRHHARRPITEP